MPSCPPGGQIVGGYCWVLGGTFFDCEAACETFGLEYDTATETYAGSGGTDASGDPVAYGAAVTKCTSKFSAKWQQAEQKAIDEGAACQTSADESDVRSGITAEVACVSSAPGTGDTACLTCGNGVIDADEDCDLGTLGGATCASASGGSLDFGTVSCDGACAFDIRSLTRARTRASSAR